VRTVVSGSLAILLLGAPFASRTEPEGHAGRARLGVDAFRHYIDEFNANDPEGKAGYVDNRSSREWLKGNIPFFECSDQSLEEMYYFRWWTYRKHIKQTPEGFVITEFLPDVPWAGKYNTISAAAAHHFYEGRWLRDRRYLTDYAQFWLRKGGAPRLYSFAAADALRAWSRVTQDQRMTVDLLPELVANYREWEKSHRDPNGLFWQIDDRDGMEFSIGGSGYRPTINSYMYGDAMALSEMAIWVWPRRADVAREFREKADEIRARVEARLWDEAAGFYKTRPRGENQSLVDVRELVGFVPWYFNLPNPGREAAWKQLTDPQGFQAAYGPTTAERRHRRFMFANAHECLWNGPSWPFATSQTLTAMANLLNGYRQDYVSKQDYLELLQTYARSQHLKLPNGKVIPFIDEDLHPDTGEWIARNLLYGMPDAEQTQKGGKDRGRDYNHSTFNDLIITGLVGLRPRVDHRLEINPLVPEGSLEYFCLDRVRYHDRDLTILYDRTGSRYGKGRGLRVYADGRQIGSAPALTALELEMPPTSTNSERQGPIP
jgi:hypothetical protein